MISFRSVMRPLLVFAVVAGVHQMWAGPAQANSTTVYIEGTTLRYSAASGYGQSVSVRLSGGVYIIDDSAGMFAGPGCSYPSPSDLSLVQCPAKGVTAVSMNMLNGNDYVDYWAPTPVTIYGGYGDDVIWGGDGDDWLEGGDGADFLHGWTGSDHLDGGFGADRIFGGDGADDRVTYLYQTAGVTADLDGVGGDDGAPGEGDTLGSDVEVLWGSPHNDQLTGNELTNTLVGYAGNDRLIGLGGDDWLQGHLGDDHMSGGDGTDTVVYFDHTTPVVADLDNEVGDDGSAGEADTIDTDVENLWGGRGDDILTGNAGPNKLEGSDGNDTTYGLGGDDKLYGKNSGLGTRDDDRLYGGDGNDIVDGNIGFDHCEGESVVNCEA